jgi:putative transposase
VFAELEVQSGLGNGDMHPDRSAPHRKRIRLESDLYKRIGTIVFLTITTRGRITAFANHALATACIDVLERQAMRDSIGVVAYCFMPDHVHILARVEGSSGVTRFVQQFKGRTTRVAWSHGVSGTLWQRSFHDHILREAETTESYIQYILQNPVRRQLVDVWLDYPLSGSFTIDLEEPFW